MAAPGMASKGNTRAGFARAYRDMNVRDDDDEA
jgi:hypothetical protein